LQESKDERSGLKFAKYYGMKATGQIVIAWAEKSGIKLNGKTEWRDSILREAYDLVWVGKAIMWVIEGTPAELRKAKEYCAKEKAKDPDYYDFDQFVVTYPASEDDPLGKARAAAVLAAEIAERKGKLK
jgi:hypothetical protein